MRCWFLMPSPGRSGTMPSTWPSRPWIRDPWVRITPAQEIPASILAWDLGAGESAVLAWAHAHPGTLAILDDAAARRCAQALGVRIRGTLGLVLLAKQRGAVPSARAVLEKLLGAGMYLDRALMVAALEMVGE